jgi:hypothetical protein
MTFSIVLFSSKHHPVDIPNHNVSDTGFCLRFRVKPTQLIPIDRASPYKQDAVLDKQRTTVTVQKRNICALTYTSM